MKGEKENAEYREATEGEGKGKFARKGVQLANCLIANIPWIIEKAREFQKNIYFCFID